MMAQPLMAEGVNVYHFPSQQHLPVQFGPYTLWLQENKNRDIFDTTTTRFVSEPPPAAALVVPQPGQTFAHGTSAAPFQGPLPDVSYTYHPQAQEFVLKGFTANVHAQQPQQLQQCGAISALQYQIALKELEKQGLETMMLREQMLKHPYTLKFTENTATSTDTQMTTCACCECKKTATQAMQVDAPNPSADSPSTETKNLYDGFTQTDYIQFIIIPEYEELDEEEDEDGEEEYSTYSSSDEDSGPRKKETKNNNHKGCFKRSKDSQSVKGRIRFFEG